VHHPSKNFVLTSGRLAASPNYILQDTGESGIVVTFWFTAFSSIRDKDGTLINVPHMLTMHENNTLGENIQKVIVAIDVYNPKELEYRIAFESIYKVKTYDTSFKNFGVAAISHLNYRHHTINLPFPEDLTHCTFSGKVILDGVTLFRLGSFDYKRG